MEEEKRGPRDAGSGRLSWSGRTIRSRNASSGVPFSLHPAHPAHYGAKSHAQDGVAAWTSRHLHYHLPLVLILKHRVHCIHALPAPSCASRVEGETAVLGGATITHRRIPSISCGAAKDGRTTRHDQPRCAARSPLRRYDGGSCDAFLASSTVHNAAQHTITSRRRTTTRLGGLYSLARDISTLAPAFRCYGLSYLPFTLLLDTAPTGSASPSG